MPRVAPDERVGCREQTERRNLCLVLKLLLHNSQRCSAEKAGPWSQKFHTKCSFSKPTISAQPASNFNAVRTCRPARRSLVPGPRSLVPGHWSLVPGPWSLVPSSWSQVPGPWSLVPGPWSLVPGPWYLFPNHLSSINHHPSSIIHHPPPSKIFSSPQNLDSSNSDP